LGLLAVFLLGHNHVIAERNPVNERAADPIHCPTIQNF
jgi:hypothetical protein